MVESLLSSFLCILLYFIVSGFLGDMMGSSMNEFDSV